MSVSVPRICPECGSDTYFAQNFPRVRDENARLRQEIERLAANHAVEKARGLLKQIEQEENQKFNQRKVHVQRLAINRLEKKIRSLKARPYEAEPMI